jgi:hypothetical protein
VLQLLVNPAIGIGCGHVKYMIMYPADYGITSADLVTNSILALWQLKWGELRSAMITLYLAAQNMKKIDIFYADLHFVQILY